MDSVILTEKYNLEVNAMKMNMKQEDARKIVVAWFLGGLMAYALTVVSYTGASFI